MHQVSPKLSKDEISSTQNKGF